MRRRRQEARVRLRLACDAILLIGHHASAVPQISTVPGVASSSTGHANEVARLRRELEDLRAQVGILMTLLAPGAPRVPLRVPPAVQTGLAVVATAASCLRSSGTPGSAPVSAPTASHTAPTASPEAANEVAELEETDVPELNAYQYASHVQAIYERYNTSKLCDLARLLQKYKNRERDLYFEVCRKNDVHQAKFYCKRVKKEL